ncbi:MAG: hypothetical protein KGH62_03995, partial [Candidatus Micrarchaeota archaeon]|nr:hypothetical protein [Candidatus Micrarchaeota archaeon]
MRGFISCIKHGGQSGNAYTISGTDGVFKSVAFNNNLVLSLGDIAKINGKITVEDKDSSFEKKVHSALKEFIADNTRKDPYKKSIKQIDAVTEKLWPNLLAASSLFLRRLMLGAPIFVRFHNAADGSSGAYSLYLAIKDLSKKATFAHNIIWIMNK